MRVDDVTRPEVIDKVRAWILRRDSCHIVTPNAEIVMQAQMDADLGRILNNSALAIPDGRGLLLAARLLGSRLREQVTGTDVFIDLCREASVTGWRVFLLGSGKSVGAQAADRLHKWFPGLTIAGVYSGSPRPEDDASIRDVISQAGRVDILVVAYGAPAQERWIERNQKLLDIPIAIGVGGVLDFVSGRVPRAPAWLRHLGFDWLFRLMVQPWRWRRQLALPRFAFLVLSLALRRRLRILTR